MREQIKKMWGERPLKLILILALAVRILAVIFSKGYGMHDDHFLVIESSQSWVDHFDYNNWLPKEDQGKINASGHSFTYSGLHYFFFRAVQSIGLVDPQIKMFLIRLLHALLSLTVVYLGFKIANKLSGIKTARIVGLMLALYFFMPNASVRNLVEVVCIPFLMYPTWMVIKRDGKMSAITWLAAGLILGFAFNIRFQCILFTGGFGLALLFQRKWLGAILVGVGFGICAVGVQGLTDFFVWGQPFVEFKEYVRYNIESARDYFSREWYMYFITLGGLLIPPISLFLLFGFFKSWKKYLILFLPSFVFLAFHSYFPNKQERFIFPIIPFIITLGMIGWNEFIIGSNFWKTRQRLLKGCWIFFWCLNTIPLLVLTVSYSKRSKVETMTYLQAKGDVKALLVENGDSEDEPLFPEFYLKKWVHEYYVNRNRTPEQFQDFIGRADENVRPNYVIFFAADNIDKRVEGIKRIYPNLKYETTIAPSFIDKLLHDVNPNNQNESCYIYKLN